MEHKIFDDYHVDCNECQHYWTDTCDGVPPNKKRSCTSFIATKRVDLPRRIDELEEKIKIRGEEIINAYIWLTVLTIALIFTSSYLIFGG